MSHNKWICVQAEYFIAVLSPLLLITYRLLFCLIEMQASFFACNAATQEAQ
jgi:hypothetical protein